MKTFVQNIALAIVMLTATAPAFATTIPLGLLTGNTTNDSRSFMQNNSMGSFTDYYTFSTIQTVNVAASITNSFTTTAQYINDFTISLFRGVPPGASLIAIASATNAVSNDPPDTETAKIKAFGQAAGNFYLKVTGSTADSPSYGGSLAIAVSMVPLPASLPMFGGALLALGAVGYGMKRKAKAAA